MSKQIILKSVFSTAVFCALAGLANSASAAGCAENDGNCVSSPGAKAGSDRQVTFRCTINISNRPDRGNCKVFEVGSNRIQQNFDFTGDTNFRTITVPTTGEYRCRVEAVAMPLS